LIISHKHKFIFLKPFKVAGSSTEFALSSIVSKNDIVTNLSKGEEKKRYSLFGIKEQNNRLPLSKLLSGFSKQNKKDIRKFAWPKVFHPHCTAEEVKRYVGDDIWNEYKKISIIRNPWDYLLSFYYWNPSGQNRPEFKNWIFENRHLIGANNLHYHIDNECIIDAFIRYEHLLTDIDRLPIDSKQRIKVKQILENTSLKSGYRERDKHKEWEMLNQANFIDKAIEAFCALELQQFKYEKLKM
jgi:hypothetical protein